MAYNASDGYIYALRGAGTTNFYRVDTEISSWETLSDISTDNTTFYANVGARIISDDSDIYVMPGDGETAFLKYDTEEEVWSRLSSTPFAQYYGTDITHFNGKIYALAGYYKDETWEYTISDNTWRKLPDNQKYTYERGPYNGASIEYAGGNSIYATTGQSLSDIWSFTISSLNYRSSGEYISHVIDLAQASEWLSFDVNDETPANTSIIYQTRTSSDGDNWSAWEEVSGTTISSAVNRYIQVKIILATTDGVSTPTVYDYSISYNSEDEKPTNPTTINAFSQQVGGSIIESGQNYPYSHPYSSWSGAQDAGSGIDGYYVYFGSDALADPESDGILSNQFCF